MDDGHFNRQRYLCPAPERAEEEEDREKWRVGRGEWEIFFGKQCRNLQKVKSWKFGLCYSASLVSSLIL
jgi:hypothetical protein